MLSLPSSSCLSRKKYDVFLSFRGEDTRKNFTDYLYAALKRSGIITFRDDPKIEAGEGIAPEIFKAIQESWCSIIIFSETYAFSHWFLDELAEITGRVQEAFFKHEERYEDHEDKKKRWRIALAEVANVKGWHLNNRHESEFIGDIVNKISSKLCQTYSVVPNGQLIGIDSRLEELHSKIDIGEDNVRIIGICGMGDIGKMTLAKVVYAQISPHFEVIISHRLCQKKVLVVIDDADNMQHLKCLVGRHDWFGLGSRIIVTARDEHLLRSYGVDDVYKPTTLEDNEALRLLNLKTFDSDQLSEFDFIQLSKHVEYADGLPLALEVLGSFLCGRDATQWKSTIERLEKESNNEIHERLLISFDGLEETEKKIFLDIACFFIGDVIP
ncbi:hypothetical protein PTKIN_Ptkin11bG0146800 [Pterospermum kingtungense]